jgi:hypothetical protein
MDKRNSKVHESNEQFIQTTLEQKLTWIGQDIRKSSGIYMLFTAIDTQSMILELRLTVPSRWQRAMTQLSEITLPYWNWYKNDDFNEKKHYHYYSMKVTDLRWRLKRKVLMQMYANPKDCYYTLLREYYKKIEKVADFPPAEMAHERRVDAIGEALHLYQ